MPISTRVDMVEVLKAQGFDQTERSGGYIRQLPTDVLAELVWDRAEEYATCSNGGWEAYICPDGCHTVPFEAPEDEGGRG